MQLIVGLGNPGQNLEKTRHNVGFRVIDEFAKKNNFPNWRKSKKNNCFYAKKNIVGKEIELIKPLLFMNNSGKVVRAIAKAHKLKGENIIVIHDDIDLALGKIKIVKNRGSAGHKGVQSVVDELKTKNFVRLRVGIRPQRTEDEREKTKNFVLQRFNKKEEAVLKDVIKRTCLAIETLIKVGLERTMNEFNK